MRRMSCRMAVAAALTLVAAQSLRAQNDETHSDSPAPRSGRTIGAYSLILFNFDSPEPGKLNRRILEEMIYEDIIPGSVIEVVGLTDVVGTEERNLRLTTERAAAVVKLIRESVPSERYLSLTGRGMGESAPLYRNDLPEGRFFNRTVRVIIDSPL